MKLVATFKTFARERLPAALVYRLQLLNSIRKARAATRSAGPLQPVSNTLKGGLVVSLTSFAPRFATLHLTLESLLNQSLTADVVVLWIAERELALLPAHVRALEKRGLTIRGCADIRSYKKLIFALKEWPDAFIATADDDVFYGPRWLETMVESVDPCQTVVICHRANRLLENDDGLLAPYRDWPLDVQDGAAHGPSCDLLPTGIGGILYPPRCLDPQVLDSTLFEKLCPTADDLWFYWMARLAGTKHKKVGGKFEQILWPTFAWGNLAKENWAGGNDRQVRNLQDRFGNPMHF